jgi:hypothetical protein
VLAELSSVDLRIVLGKGCLIFSCVISTVEADGQLLGCVVKTIRTAALASNVARCCSNSDLAQRTRGASGFAGYYNLSIRARLAYTECTVIVAGAWLAIGLVLVRTEAGWTSLARDAIGAVAHA